MQSNLLVNLHVITAQAFGVVLFVAGIVKVFDRPGTFASVLAYQVVPVRGARGVAFVLPWLELSAAVSLGTGVAILAGAGLAAGLFALFAVVQTVALARGRQVPCGCFGSASSEFVSWGKVVANAMLAAVCLGLLVGEVLGGVGVKPSLRLSDQLWVRAAVTLVVHHYWSVRQILENRRIIREDRYPYLISAAESTG